MLEPPPKIRRCRQDGERARYPDARGHQRLKPEAEAKLRQDETGKHELGEGIGLAHEERRDGNGRNVTFPTRSYVVNGDRRSFALLRPLTDVTAQNTLRELILEAFAEYEERAAIAS